MNTLLHEGSFSNDNKKVTWLTDYIPFTLTSMLSMKTMGLSNLILINRKDKVIISQQLLDRYSKILYNINCEIKKAAKTTNNCWKRSNRQLLYNPEPNKYVVFNKIYLYEKMLPIYIWMIAFYHNILKSTHTWLLLLFYY